MYRDKEVEAINWEDWKSKIQTKGLVEKVEENYKNLVSEKYDTQSVCK